MRGGSEPYPQHASGSMHTILLSAHTTRLAHVAHAPVASADLLVRAPRTSVKEGAVEQHTPSHMHLEIHSPAKSGPLTRPRLTTFPTQHNADKKRLRPRHLTNSSPQHCPAIVR